MTNFFLHRVAKHVMDSFSDAPEECAVVLPSQRAAVYFRRHFSAQVQLVQFSPKLLTLDQFVQQFSDLTPADSIELLFLLYESYKAVWKGDAEPFDRFLKWAPMAISDFSEIDAYLVDPKNFFRDLTNLKELEEWSLNDGDLTQAQQNYAWFWKKLGELYFHFTKALREKKLAYSGMLFKDAAKNITNQKIRGVRKVFFCGFNALSASEEKIMKHFVEHHLGEMLWDADQFYTDYSKHAAGHFLRKNFAAFSGEKNWISKQLTNSDKKINIVSVPNAVAQADLMAQTLQQNESHTQSAVILADENLLTPVLNALPNSVASVNVTMGHNIKNSPLHSLFELLFDWLSNRTDDGKYHHRHITRMLGHPFLRFSADFVKEANTFVAHLKAKNLVYVGPQEFNSEETPPLIRSFFDGINAKSLAAADQLNAQFYLLNFILGSLKTGEGQALEREYLYHYLKTLRRVEHLITAYPEEMHGEAYARIFGSLVSSDKLNFVGEPLEGLQIMGMLETRALDFKNLIILSCNDHLMPGSSAQQSLLPFDLKKFHNLPTQNEKESIYAYYFYRLLQRAENITLAYSVDSNAWQGSEPSRYLAQIKYDFKDLPHVNIASQVATSASQLPTTDPVSIYQSEAVTEAIKNKLERSLSPSALNNYIQCPLDFYYTYVLGYKEAKEVEETIEHSTLGSVVHEVLEKLYTPFIKNGPLKQTDLQGAAASIRALTQAEFDHPDVGANTKTGLNKLIFEVAVSFSERFVKKEIEELIALEKKGQYVEIQSLEQPLNCVLEVPTESGNVQVNLYGKADRIDKIGDTIRVIDYKTGKVAPQDVSLKNPIEDLFSVDKSKALQLLLYGYMYSRMSKETGKIMVANVSMRNLKKLLIPVGWAGDDTLTPEHFEDFEKILVALISPMVSGPREIAHNPEAKYCEFCKIEQA